jgi:ribosomal protein S18 acetylase RimI-like enzyme
MTISELTPGQFDELSALEQRVLAADGVRLKLEWHYIRQRATTASLVVTDGAALVGFLGLYAFGGPPDVEMVGMVDPGHRRRGVATALLDRALEICTAGGFTHRLLVVPRQSAAGGALALARGAELEHSEFSLALDRAPERPPENPKTTIRAVTAADRPDRIRILTAGFGPPPPTMLDRLSGDGFWNVIVEHAGAVVGTARLSVEGGRGYVGGFAIDPEFRGRGIGRDALGRFCVSLRDRGCDRVELQVAVENDLALGLYTSTGFRPVSTEDYYRL